MNPLQHLKYSTAAAAILLISTKSLKPSAGCVAAGVLVDLDHLLEYQSYCRGNWDWEEFSTGEYFNKKGTIKVIFHSWEAAALMWGIVKAKKRFLRKSVFFGTAVGYTLHLILDQIGNNTNLKAYFVLYRMLVNWQQDKLLEKKRQTVSSANMTYIKGRN